MQGHQLCLGGDASAPLAAGSPRRVAFPKDGGKRLRAQQESLELGLSSPPVPSPWQAAQSNQGGKILQLHLELWKEFTARVKTRLLLPNKAETCKAAGASEMEGTAPDQCLSH